LASPLFAAQKDNALRDQAVFNAGGKGDGISDTRVQVMIEMNAAPAAVRFAAELKVAQAEAAAKQASVASSKGKAPLASAANAGKLPRVEISAAATVRVQSEIAQMDGAQQALLPSLQNLGAHVLYRQQRAYNGIAVYVDADKISQLAALPGVKAIHPMAILQANAFSSVDFLSTRTFWNKAYSAGVGIHGENIKVAVIDTGLDYIHTNFGGPGTDAAYASVSDKSPVPNPYFPTAKIPGGFDFAGDLYTGGNTPAPDPNPLDGNGHGTGCASLVGGFGTNFGGSTYMGNYDSTTPISTLKISPGMAPQCKLYPVKISGPAGSSGILSQGYEWTLDPNGDGDFSDRMDVISCSFGGAAGPPDDATSVSATNCAAAGILVAQSAGNNGDSYYMVAEPSVASRTLSVAASFNDQSGFISTAAVVGNSPGSIAGQTGFAIYASTGPHSVVSGNVIRAVPGDATTALTNAAQVNGNIVLIDRGTNTFSDKATKAIAAGAIGIIVANNARTDVPNNDPITQGTGSEVTVPDVMISKEDGDYIKGAAGFNSTTGVPTNATPVTIRPDNTIVARSNGPSDTLASYSVRGPRNNDSWLKPDITAPAEVVGVALNGVGQPSGGLRNQVALFNGTSSAAPQVAGCLALMKQLHPDWTVEEVHALAMNTALHNLETTTARTVTYGVGRVGAGRIDNNFASAANGVAFNGTDLGMVSLSFGVVDVPVDGAVHLVKNMIVRNKGTAPLTYSLSYQDNGPASDASVYYGTTHALNFTVAPGASEVVPIQFNATGNTVAHTRDPSASNGQATDFGTFGRQWLTEKCGYAVLSPQGSSSEPTLRVPLHAVPRAVAAMHAAVTQVTPAADSGQFTIPLSGVGINIAGIPTNTVSNGKVNSFVKTFELSYASPLANSPSAPTGNRFKVKYVGVTSDYVLYGGPSSDHTPTTISFAIDAFGDETTSDYARGTQRYILLDTDKNGTDDYRIYASELFASLPPAGQSSNNVYFSYSTNNVSGAGFGEYPINGLASNQADTNFFNNSLRVLSFDARDVGYTGGASSFNYHVVTFDDNGALVDDTGTLTYDLARPGIDTHTGSQFEPSGNFFNDLPGINVPVNYNGANFQANQSKGILFAHFHNGPGNRSDVVVLAKPTISGFSPTHAKVGANVLINGTNFGPATKVFFFNNKQASPVTLISANTVEVKVPAGAVTGPITVSNAGGSSTSSASFTVDPGASSSNTVVPRPTSLLRN
jgi:subtilisin family serine protease